MGSGLSMASVNKIKELAGAREYSLAVDIIDTQDLSRSLNPQFLRTCAKVYTEVGRYKDARKLLIMAHRMAPEGKRIIYSFVYLYLKMGYFDLAKTYYDLYMFNADENNPETKQLMFIYDKANKKDLDTLDSHLSSTYRDNMDYDWSFETYLLYVLRGRNKEAEMLADDYIATYKNSDNCNKIEAIRNGTIDAKDLFYIFASDVVQDDDPEQENLREEEEKLLKADDLRIHPKEAEITIMVDDMEEAEIGSKRRLKKFLKEKERQEDESDDEAATTEDNDEAVEDVDGNQHEKKSFSFKGLFVRKNKAEHQDEDVESSLDKSQDKSEAETENVLEKEKSESGSEILLQEEKNEPQSDSDAEQVVEPEVVSDKETVKPNDVREEADNKIEAATEVISAEDESNIETEADLMREVHLDIHKSKYDTVLTVDTFDDDFTAESETIEDLKDDLKSDRTSAFETVFGESLDADTKSEDEPTAKKKSEIIFEDAEIAYEDDEEDFEVDDFSVDVDDEFGEMKIFDNSFKSETLVEDMDNREPVDRMFEESIEELSEKESGTDAEESVEEEAESDTEEPIIIEESNESVEDVSEPEPETEKIAEESYGEEIEAAVQEVIGEEPETHTDMDESVEEEPNESVEDVFETEAEEIIEESYGEEIEATVQEVIGEEPEVDTDMEEPVEEVPDESVEDVLETETEEIIEETYDEEVEETFEEVIEEELETEEEESIEEVPEEDISRLFKRDVPKKKLDFPVFRSSLFPNYHKEITEVENNFEEIVAEANDKIQENLLKEEQMQREAEALLASLGIDLSSVTATAGSYESVSQTLNEGPSRDELKASLKIDSVKKDILKKIKEYR